MVKKIKQIILGYQKEKNELDKKIEDEVLRLEQTYLELEIKADNERQELLSQIDILQNTKEKQQKEIYELMNITQEQAKKIRFFDEEYTMFYIYKSLNEESKAEIDKVFKDANAFDEFIARGLGKTEIEKLYDLISHRIMGRNYQDVEKLNQIYLSFVELFNKKFQKQVFEVDNIQLEQEFSATKHIKCTDSSQSGIIEKIYLRGFVYKSSQQSLEKKSIVKVGN